VAKISCRHIPYRGKSRPPGPKFWSSELETGGAGGAGTANSISGSPVTYAGGGGGASTNSVGNSGAGGNGADGIAIITTYF